MLPYSINQILATEVLEHSSEIATKIERNYEQCQVGDVERRECAGKTEVE
jgi:hypothetical protein